MLGRPERHYATVHVGGTNGKGSTAALLASILRASGFRVGLYTSPHLVSVGERIRVDGVAIGEAAVARWVARLEAEAVRRDASFFEITTAVAFADFAARGVEIAVIEVGLGGRLDATNVIVPLASGVTRIALEHTDYLGDSLEVIAREKAGIAKPGVPFLTTEPDQEIAGILLKEAQGRGAPSEWVSPAAAAGRPLGLVGPHQVANASLALRLAQALPEPYRPDAAAIAAGLAAARLPGRFDRRGPWLFDVAHNPDGMRALVAALMAAPPPRPLAAVVTVLRDKAWTEMLALLAPAVDLLLLTCAPSAPVERAWDLDLVREAVRGVGGAGIGKQESGIGAPAVEIEPDLKRALAAARARAATVLVTGSFHTVGDAMACLPGLAPLG